jgi:hypothetical protein
VLGFAFLLIAIGFVYRSFYGMRIDVTESQERPTPELAGSNA